MSVQQPVSVGSGSTSAGGMSRCRPESTAAKSLTKTLTQTLPPSLRGLIDAVERHDHLTPTLAKKLLGEAAITPRELAPWADFDHSPSDSYGRKLVYDGGFFELMVMSWTDGDMAAIHDHGHTQWGAVQLFGRAEHAIFRRRGNHLTTAERRVFEPGSVVAVGHELIHQMGNVGEDDYLTLHLYGCYEREGDVTADARLYNLDEGRIQITSGGVFFALPEDAIDRRAETVEADFPTLLRDRVELLGRLLRSRGAWDRPSLETADEQRLAAWLFDRRTWLAAGRELEQRLDENDASTRDRYLGVLHQELRAAARLQLRLVGAGLPAEGLAGKGRELHALLEADGHDLEAFGNAYLDLVADTYRIELPTAVLA